MCFEYHNPRKRVIECVFAQPIGCILVPGGSFVPSPEQEDAGVTADMFDDFHPSFLKRTPPALRRRLLQAIGREVPKDIVNSTAHLEEFGGGVAAEEQERVDEVLETVPKRAAQTVHRYVTVEEYERVKAKSAPPAPPEAPKTPEAAEQAPTPSKPTVVPPKTSQTPPVAKSKYDEDERRPKSEAHMSRVRKELDNAMISDRDPKGQERMNNNLSDMMDAACSSISRRRHRKNR